MIQDLLRNSSFNSGSVRNFGRMYTLFCELNGPDLVTKQDFYKILTLYLKDLQHDLLYEGRDIDLGILGTLRITKHKPKTWAGKIHGGSLNIDYKLTKQYGKPIYHTNEHSGGYKYRFVWMHKDKIHVNKKAYKLIATWHNKRSLAQIIKNKVRDYIES